MSIGQPIGDWNKIEEKIFSAASYIEFLGLSSLKRYKIIYDGYASSTNKLQCRINNDTGNVYEASLHRFNAAATPLHDVIVSAVDAFDLDGADILTTYGERGELIITTVLNNSNYQYLTGTFIQRATASIYRTDIIGVRIGASAMVSIRIYPVAGTITGKAILYEGMM